MSLPLALTATAGLAIFFGGAPGFRDGAHFYGPLFQYLYEELSAGRFPLWNPYENLGQPLAANPVTMLFYPGTWLALLVLRLGGPFGMPVSAAYFLFMLGHLLLAVLTTYRLARSRRCGPTAATLAGICYALGGNILFQWNNAPFLVGAAWFPEALRFSARIVRRRKIADAAGCAVVLALMTLGGDLQASYNAVLCSLILFVFADRKYYRLSDVPRIAGLFLFSGVLAFLLAAVQLIPAAELALYSDRTHSAYQSTIMLFSVPPWRLIEFFFPNAGGWQFPVHARWFSFFSADQNIWVPSFYMGLLPGTLVLAVVSTFGRTKRRFPSMRYDIAAASILLLFAAGALGDWIGVYPAFLFLPVYSLFRFPAKLLTVASLMFALLAASGFDRLLRDDRFRARSEFLMFAAVSVFSVAALALLSMPPEIFGLIPPCILFGPFDAEAARSGLFYSLVSVILFFIVFEIAVRCRIPQRTNVSKAAGFLLLAAVFLDLSYANYWMFAPVRAGIPVRPSPLTDGMDFRESGPDKNIPLRIYRLSVWYPSTFESLSSGDRLAEIRRWNADSLYPRYALPQRIAIVNVPGTLTIGDYREILRELSVNRREESASGFEDMLERLGVRYIIAPKEENFDADRIAAKPDWPEEVGLWKLRDPVPRNYLRFEPNRLIFDVSLAKTSCVVVPEQYWPGWRAFVGDREISVRKIDRIFRGVDLPAGEHRVSLVYDPLAFKIGLVLSLFGLALTARCLISRRAPG